MAKCETCGNEYGDLFQVMKGGREHQFDSFECAIHKLAPCCQRCGCRVIGHGVQDGSTVYCSAHCARESGVGGIKDHV